MFYTHHSSESMSCNLLTAHFIFIFSPQQCIKQAVPVSAKQVSFAPVVCCYHLSGKESIKIPLEQSVKSAIFASKSSCKVQKLRSKLNIPCLPPRKFPPPPPPHLNKPCVQQCAQPQSSNSWFALNIPYLPPRKFPPPLPPHTDKPCVQRLPCAHKLYT